LDYFEKVKKKKFILTNNLQIKCRKNADLKINWLSQEIGLDKNSRFHPLCDGLKRTSEAVIMSVGGLDSTLGLANGSLNSKEL
jgi:hypothetical protein